MVRPQVRLDEEIAKREVVEAAAREVEAGRAAEAEQRQQ